MRKILILLVLSTILVSGFAQNTKELSGFTVPNHKCEFSKMPSNEFQYEGRNYEYYQKFYLKAQKQQKMGMILGLGGLGLAGFGILSFDNSPEVNPSTQELPIIMMISGGLLAGYGIPAYFFGNKKAQQNLKIMEKFPEHQAKMGLAFTPNGLGLVLQF